MSNTKTDPREVKQQFGDLLSRHRKLVAEMADGERTLRARMKAAPAYTREQEEMRDDVVDHIGNAVARLQEARAHLAMAARDFEKLFDLLVAEYEKTGPQSTVGDET